MVTSKRLNDAVFVVDGIYEDLPCNFRSRNFSEASDRVW